MNISDLAPGQTYLLNRVRVKFLKVAGWNDAIWVKAPNGKPFPASASQLMPPSKQAIDPRLLGLTDAQRTLLDTVIAHPGLDTKNLAAIVNGDTDRERKWTATTVALVGRRLENLGRAVTRKPAGEKRIIIEPK